MENLKFRKLMLIGMISVGIFGTGISYAINDEGKSLENNSLKNRREYRDMKVTLSRIADDKNRIELHKKALKTNKAANKKIEAHMSKKELRKAKADLRRDKKHLKTDKKDLKSDQKVAIRNLKLAKHKVVKELRLAKRELRKNLRKGNTGKLAADAQRVDYLTWKKKKLETSSKNLTADIDQFFNVLNKEISQVV